MRYLIALILFAHISVGRPGYFKRFTPTSAISLSSGAAGYFGDITPFNVYLSNGPQSIKSSVGVEFSRNFKRNLHYRINLNYIKLSADDKYYDTCSVYRANYVRNLNFSTNMLETSVMLQYDTNLDRVTPYFFAGAGHIAYSVNNSPVIKNSVSVPFGVGVKTKLSNRIEIAAELNYRYTMSDDIDDVLDNRVYSQPEKPYIMKGNDLFYTAQIKVTYKIPVQIKCFTPVQTIRYKINKTN